MRVENMIKRAVEDRCAQICAEKAQKIGVEEFKKSMSMLTIAGISQQADSEMNEYLLAAVILFKKEHKLDSCLICGAKNGEPCDAGLHG